MRLIKTFAVLIAFAGAGALALAIAPSAFAQSSRRADGADRQLRRLNGTLLPWAGGSDIGVSVRDLRSSDRRPPGESEGVVVEEVQPGSPADKAGLEPSDIVVSFDGERVRSARQFARVVEETPAGRPVSATVLRDGKRQQVEITPAERESMAFDFDTDRLRDRLGDIGRYVDRLPPMNFAFDLTMPETAGSRFQLGIATTTLSDQLGEYFGAKDGGVLVSAVRDDTRASRAGVKAGDVITSVDGEAVRTRGQLMRALVRTHEGETVTLGIVRDRRAMTIEMVAPDRL